jgi:hypothetical protein
MEKSIKTTKRPMDAAKSMAQSQGSNSRARSAEANKKPSNLNRVPGGPGYSKTASPFQPQTNNTKTGKIVKFEQSGYNSDYLTGGQQQMKPPFAEPVPGEDPKYISKDSNKMTFGRSAYFGPQMGNANLQESSVGLFII